MLHTCQAPHPWKEGELCGAEFHGRSDAKYCPGGGCRKRAHHARPAVARARRFLSLKMQLERARSVLANTVRRVRLLEAQRDVAAAEIKRFDVDAGARP